MARELYPFSQAFDAALIINPDVKSPYSQTISLKKVIDSEKMFHIGMKATHMTERRLKWKFRPLKNYTMQGNFRTLD